MAEAVFDFNRKARTVYFTSLLHESSDGFRSPGMSIRKWRNEKLRVEHLEVFRKGLKGSSLLLGLFLRFGLGSNQDTLLIFQIYVAKIC